MRISCHTFFSFFNPILYIFFLPYIFSFVKWFSNHFDLIFQVFHVSFPAIDSPIILKIQWNFFCTKVIHIQQGKSQSLDNDCEVKKETPEFEIALKIAKSGLHRINMSCKISSLKTRVGYQIVQNCYSK